MGYTLSELCARVGGKIDGDTTLTIESMGDIRSARPGDLAFIEDPRFARYVPGCKAAAVMVGRDTPPLPGKTLLRVDSPRKAFISLMQLFEKPSSLAEGVHASAAVDPAAQIGSRVSIGENSVVRGGARIGEGTRIDALVHIGADVSIGRDCRIMPGVVLMDRVQVGDRVIIHSGTVIGGDGFGYIPIDGRAHKIPQIGTVIIEDDVEIGCNTCVDRAMLGVTRVGRGAKIDNQVQVAHNNDIGEGALIAGQAGMAGSVTIGAGSVLGGKVGVSDHITVGPFSRLGIGSLVLNDLPGNADYWGRPAHDSAEAKRETAALKRLPELLREVRRLRERVEKLEAGKV